MQTDAADQGTLETGLHTSKDNQQTMEIEDQDCVVIVQAPLELKAALKSIEKTKIASKK